MEAVVAAKRHVAPHACRQLGHSGRIVWRLVAHVPVWKAEQALTEILLRARRRLVPVGYKIVHCLDSGRAVVSAGAHLHRSGSAGKGEKTITTSMTGEIHQNVHPSVANRAGQRLIIELTGIQPAIGICHEPLRQVVGLRHAGKAQDLEGIAIVLANYGG